MEFIHILGTYCNCLLKHFIMAALTSLIDNSNMCIILVLVPIITLWICYYETLNI